MIGREEEISNVYKASDEGSRLNFTVARYSLRGELLGLDSGVSGDFFQMCPGSFSELDAAFDFGTRYSKRCKIPARQLFAEGEPEFYDLYVPYLSKMEKETHLFAVPMLIRNLGGSNLVSYLKLSIGNTYKSLRPYRGHPRILGGRPRRLGADFALFPRGSR